VFQQTGLELVVEVQLIEVNLSRSVVVVEEAGFSKKAGGRSLVHQNGRAFALGFLDDRLRTAVFVDILWHYCHPQINRRLTALAQVIGDRIGIQRHRLVDSLVAV